MDIRKKLLEIITYHGNEGTSGYLLDEERIEKILKLIRKVVKSVPTERENDGQVIIDGELADIETTDWTRGYNKHVDEIEHWKKEILEQLEVKHRKGVK